MKFALLAGAMAAAFNMSSSLIAQTPVPPVDYVSTLKDGGTVAVLVWIVLYFMKRSDADKARLEAIADSSITANEKTSESLRELALALHELKNQVQPRNQ